jgi:hypothetical protein
LFPDKLSNDTSEVLSKSVTKGKVMRRGPLATATVWVTLIASTPSFAQSASAKMLDQVLSAQVSDFKDCAQSIYTATKSGKQPPLLCLSVLFSRSLTETRPYAMSLIQLKKSPRIFLVWQKEVGETGLVAAKMAESSEMPEALTAHLQGFQEMIVKAFDDDR